MTELVFSVFVVEIKNAWKTSVANEDLIQNLYDAVALPLNLTGRNGEPISVDKSTASRIMNRQDNVHQKVRDGATRREVTDSIVEYFKTSVLGYIRPDYPEELIHKLNLIINADTQISESKKSEFAGVAQKSTLAEFLASVFLYTLSRVNKLPKTNLHKSQNEQGYKTHSLVAVDPPSTVVEYEQPYVLALMEAYGEDAGKEDFSQTDLPNYPKYSDNFSRQRKYFYAAETVRRGTRDIYRDSDQDQFQVLKDEMYEGVIEVWEEKHKNGVEKLGKVMTQAAVTPVDRCWLSRDTDWIGNSQKKGVCHFLVNDQRLKGWVMKDDE